MAGRFTAGGKSFSYASVDEVKAIVAMISAPRNFPVIRMRDQFATAKTVAVRPWVRLPLQWTPGQTSNPPTSNNLRLPLADSAVILFRDPLRSYIAMKKAFGAGSTGVWNWNSTRTNGTNSTTFTYVRQGNQVGPQQIIPCSVSLASGTTPHDTELPSFGGGGKVGEARRGVWIDTNTVVTVTFSGAAASAGRLVYYIWNGQKWGGPISAAYAAGATTVSTANITTPNYIAFELENVAAETTITTYTVAHTTTYDATTGTDIWAHHSMPGLMQNRDNVQGMRVLAGSVLLKNVASPLYQEGMVTQYQVPGVNEWRAIVGDAASGGGTGFALISGSESAEWRKWSEGAYSFLKVSDMNDLAMKTPFTFGAQAGASSTTQNDMCCQLDDYKDYIVIYATSTSGPSPSGGDGQLELGWAAEFKTENDFFDEDPPRALPDSWEAALEATTSMRQHYANGVHLADIWKTIGSVARVAGPILSSFGHPYAKVAGAVASGLGQFEENSRKRGFWSAFKDFL